MTVTERVDVCIVGACTGGLACARALTYRGAEVTVLEASDRVGGRIATDELDGFLLDRGFQIVLTAYPEVHHQLDVAALDLRRFEPGALVWLDGRLRRVADPLRRPGAVLSTAAAPIGTPADKLRMLALVADVRRTTPRELLRRPECTTRERLAERGFSDRMVERFFRPLFAGIQLDPDLEVSSRRFELVLAMLAEGDAALPAAGMAAIPAQLAGTLPDGAVRLGTRVDAVEGTTALAAGGRRVQARALVVATEGPAAAALLGLPDPGSRSESCVYFAADRPPIDAPILVLDGEGTGPATNLAITSNVAPGYAPPGRSLIAVEVPGPLAGTDDELEQAVRTQLRGWFGGQVDRWEHLRTYRIAHAHPDQRPGFSPKRRVRLGGGVYVCGDHRDTASIQGALYSGKRTAGAVLADLHRPA